MAAFHVGDLVRITQPMGHVASGTSGEVLGVDRGGQALVHWTDGRLDGIIRVPLGALEQAYNTRRGAGLRRRSPVG